MADSDIQGTVTNSLGNAVTDAIVYLWKEDSPNKVIQTTTDSNGNYIFDGHPDGDGTSDEWHVSAYYTDPDGKLINTLSKPKVSASLPEPFVIPDISMFQNPIYQWTAVDLGFSQGATVNPWDDELSAVSASAVNSPTFEDDQSGFEAVDYQSSDTDHHTISSDGQLPTGGDPVSVVATVYVKTGCDGCLFGYGNASQDETVELQLRTNGDGTGTLQLETWQGSIRVQADSYDEGAWITVGGWLSDANGGKAYINGSSAGSDSTGSLNQKDSNRAIGYRTWASNLRLDAYLYDLVVCAGKESDQAFSDYDNDRLG